MTEHKARDAHQENGLADDAGETLIATTPPLPPATATTSGGASGLRESERSMMEAAGIGAAEIEAIEQRLLVRGGSHAKKHTANLAALIAEQAVELITGAGGKPLFAGRDIGAELIRRELYPPVRGYNSFGDFAGKRGLCLPSVVYQGRRRYDLSAVDTDAAARETRQQELRLMRPEVIAKLVAQSSN